VPRTRTTIHRHDKEQEILDCAERQLLTGGFESMSMAAIARELGVAQNTLYWYFPSKDDLLVTVFRRTIDRAAARRPPAGATIEQQAIWLFDEMEAITPLRTAIHARAVVSEPVNAVRAEGHAGLKALVRTWLPSSVDPRDQDLIAEGLLAAGEGLLLSNPPRRDRNRTLRFFVQRLTR
jgi:AcrR family transcriptional regulator